MCPDGIVSACVGVSIGFILRNLLFLETFPPITLFIIVFIG